MCICQTLSFGVWKWELEKFKNVKMFKMFLLFFIIYYEVLIVISDFNNNNENIPPAKGLGNKQNQKPWYNFCFEPIYTSKSLSEEWL